MRKERMKHRNHHQLLTLSSVQPGYWPLQRIWKQPISNQLETIGSNCRICHLWRVSARSLKWHDAKIWLYWWHLLYHWTHIHACCYSNSPFRIHVVTICCPLVVYFSSSSPSILWHSSVRQLTFATAQVVTECRGSNYTYSCSFSPNRNYFQLHDDNIPLDLGITRRISGSKVFLQKKNNSLYFYDRPLMKTAGT